jgi:arsenate reductase
VHITVYHYAGCSTCRKARKFLVSHNVDVTLVDLKAHPPTADTLAELHASSGLPVKKFFNTSGQSYRGGGFKDRLPTMSDADAHAALAADGMLVKRPILSIQGASGTRVVLVGFKEAAWADALGVGGPA